MSTEDSKSNVLDDSQDVEVEPDTSELEEKGKKVGKLESFKFGSFDCINISKSSDLSSRNMTFWG